MFVITVYRKKLSCKRHEKSFPTFWSSVLKNGFFIQSTIKVFYFVQVHATLKPTSKCRFASTQENFPQHKNLITKEQYREKNFLTKGTTCEVIFFP